MAFHTKPQIALNLVERAQAAGIAFGAVVADCFYGDDRVLEKALLDRRLPHVLARRGALGRGRALAKADYSFNDAAQSLPLSAWQPVIRRFQDSHTERWWAAELTLFGYGPDKPVRAVCATTDRVALPALSPGTSPPTCRASRRRWAKLCGCTVCAIGWNKATNR